MIDSLTAPVRSADQFMVALFAQFTGNGSSAPSNVRGRGVSVTRTAAGTYEVTFPATLTLAMMRGLQLALTQAAASKYELQATISGGKLVITAKSGGWVQEFTKTAADGAAGDATAETAIGYSAEAATLTSVRFVPAAALTANNTNYATLTVSKRSSSGGSKTTVAQVTTQITGSGNWTQWAAVDVPISAAAIAAGDSLTYEISKTAGGVAVPAGRLVLTAKGGAVDLASTETVLATAWVRDSSH